MLDLMAKSSCFKGRSVSGSIQLIAPDKLGMPTPISLTMYAHLLTWLAMEHKRKTSVRKSNAPYAYTQYHGIIP